MTLAPIPIQVALVMKKMKIPLKAMTRTVKKWTNLIRIQLVDVWKGTKMATRNEK
jgi:hypothetical protein